MTVIAAVAREGRVVMAADRVATIGSAMAHAPAKIRRKDAGGLEVLLACAGAAELLPTYARHFTLDAPGADLHDWAQGMAEDITRHAAKMTPSVVVNGSSPDDRGMLDAMLILGHAGRLWMLDANMACPVPDGVVAIGSGGEVALGAMHAALAAGVDPCGAAVQAVEIACRFTTDADLLGMGPLVEELAHP